MFIPSSPIYSLLTTEKESLKNFYNPNKLLKSVLCLDLIPQILGCLES